MEAQALHVAVDVGCRRHRAAIGNLQGPVLAEFDVEHNAAGFTDFFRRIEEQRDREQPVWVAMEGWNCAELAGEIGDHERFDGEASLALYLGAATLDNTSGQQRGSKTPRQVNRRAKTALMNAVDHHRRHVPSSRSYYEKKRAQGKTHNQALRALARHMVRVLWSMFVHDRDYELRENDTEPLENSNGMFGPLEVARSIRQGCSTGPEKRASAGYFQRQNGPVTMVGQAACASHSSSRVRLASHPPLSSAAVPAPVRPRPASVAALAL